MVYFLGVDVGTASVRVGLFADDGHLVGIENKEISIVNPKKDFYEQSSTEIWNAICLCIRNLIKENCDDQKLLDKTEIVSIGFDATCSLVVLDSEFRSLPVSESSRLTDIIMWMDHRATEQANYINATGHRLLDMVGGKISPEMDPPKILWLKENMHDVTYSKAAHFFSLPDFLVWKATNTCVRSVCTTTCKWLYDSQQSNWDGSLWEAIDLPELMEDNHVRIGCDVRKPFEYLEQLRISGEMMDATGLSDHVKIGVSMIDAHAGGIGGISMTMNFFKQMGKYESQSGETNKLEKHLSSLQIKPEEILVLVSGTSSCFMASSKEPNYIDGIWGPYYQAMVPGLFLNEAGQSLCGKLIDHVIETHPACEELKQLGGDIYDKLHKFLIELAKQENLGEENLSVLTKHVHIYPDFHGNRSPLADPNLKGSITGMTLDKSINNLCLVYLACIQSIVYQTKQIISILQNHSMDFKVITLIGGLSKNKLYCELLSDICNLPVLASENNEHVLLGSSILGAANCERFKNVCFSDLIDRFSNIGDVNVILPKTTNQKYHEKKYKVFLKLLEHQKEYTDIMD